MKIAFVSGDDIVHDDPQHLCAAVGAHDHEAALYLRQRRRRSTPPSGPRIVCTPVGPSGPVSPAEVMPYVGEWAAALERKWASSRPDVVHAYGWLGGLAAQLAARRQRIPTVQSLPGLSAARDADSPRGRVEAMLARSAVWATGESSGDVDLLARLRRSRARVSALTCGVDVERFTPTGPVSARTGLHRIVCPASNPLPHNGFDLVLRALTGVPGAEVVLAETDASTADHDEARAGLRRLAAELGVRDRVGFAGTVDDDNLAVLLRSADAVVCAPRQPPHPAPALKAMACGAVVVALPVGVLPDVIVDNVTGLVLSPEHPRALAATLRGLVGQSFQCESMGSAGRSRAVSRFAWDRIAHDALNIYRQVAVERTLSGHLQSAGQR